MQDALGGKKSIESAVLRPKVYSYLADDSEKKQRSKSHEKACRKNKI